ncbi:hypothetical protein ACN47E_003652 [Coniothyrium glycines]
MPPARLPNASLFASADLSLLPLLAPRVFADPRISRSGHQYARTQRSAKEAEKTGSGRAKSITASQASRWTQETVYCLHDAQKSAAGLLQAPSTKNTLRSTRQPSSGVNATYAAIFTYAKAHVRSYFTFTRDGVARRVESTPSVRRARRTRPPRTRTMRNSHAQRAHSARQKLLDLTMRRLHNFRLFENNNLPKRMIEQGQYRSLRRRILNLRQWNSTQLDIGNTSKGLPVESQLLQAFAALDRRTFDRMSRLTRKLTIKHDKQHVRWCRQFYHNDGGSTSAQMSWAWLELDEKNRSARALPILLYLLDRKPGRALDFIETLANDPLRGPMADEMIADAFAFLAKLHAKGTYRNGQGWQGDAVVVRHAFAQAFTTIHHRFLYRKRGIWPQDLLYSMVKITEIDDLEKVFEALSEHRTRVDFDTILHYAATFAEKRSIALALRCLHELHARSTHDAWKFLVSRERLRWTCAVILRASMKESQEYHDTPKIIEAFVQMGISMDILLYNVVMQNAMDAGDYTTAFKVFNSLESNGLKPDGFTFSILLNGCTLQSNPAMFRDFAEYCIEVALDIRDPFIATSVLYYHYVHHRNNTDVQLVSSNLWRIYLRLFSAAPLEPFLSHRRSDLRNAITRQQAQTDTEYLEPTLMALYLMLQIEIKSASYVSYERLSILYQQFKVLINNGTNRLRDDLARDAMTWNAFLHAFCERQQFASASQCIKDMMHGPVAPNVYSLNIFMQAFFKTGQIRAAERVFDIMRQRGIDPDQYTYGVMIRGFAKAQLVDRVADTMKHLDTSQELDPDLLRSLASIVNRNELMHQLEKNRLEKEVTAAEAVDEAAKKERRKWLSMFASPVTADALSSSSSKGIPKSDGSQATTGELAGKTPASSKGLLESDPPTTEEQVPVLRPSRTLHEEQKALSALRSSTARQNSRDPDVQYRILQEQLGIVLPSGSHGSRKDIHDLSTSPPQVIGSSLEFKSMLSEKSTADAHSEKSGNNASASNIIRYCSSKT